MVKIVKICAAAWLLDTRGNFDRSCRYNQPVQYGRDAAHKSRAAWAFRSLEVYMSEIQHIYEDLNESSSARPGGSQQWKILPSPNSKRAPNFSAQIMTRRRNLPRRGDFNVRHSSIVGLNFTRCINSVYPPKFSAWIFRRNFPQQFFRTNFPSKFSARIFRRNFPQQFSTAIFRKNFPQEFSAWIFRRNFPQKFSAWILGIRHNFHET